MDEEAGRMKRLVVCFVDSDQTVGAEIASKWVADEACPETVATMLEHVSERVRALGVAGTIAAVAHAKATHREARERRGEQ